MDLLPAYDMASKTINALIKKAYTSDFLMDHETDCLHCQETSRALSRNKFTINEVYRFEGNTDPADEMIVFTISSTDRKSKGFVVNTYVIYSGYKSQKLVEHLPKKI
ncbi:phosphoribosylpyrophosphate synthetase [Sphingobacteriaceae bacterium]|nr:phosphoribosylpyrophosphate synthetase [Sphingobacteriaceae bacterium]